MHKKFSFLLSFILIFTTFFGSISYGISNDEVLQENIINEIESHIFELENELEMLLNESIMDLNQQSINDSLDKSIEMTESQVFELKNNSIDYSYNRNIFNKFYKFTELLEDQYTLKKDFTSNIQTQYKLIKSIKNDLSIINNEIKNFYLSEDKDISMEEFYQINYELKSIIQELKNNKYNSSNIVKATIKYIKEVTKLQLFDANNTFKYIVQLQNDNILLLNNISNKLNNIILVLE